MAIVTIDGKQYTLKSGKNLLQVCLSVGIDLPYFCWHPALGSVGACRQCAAKQFADENDQRGRLVTACMTPVNDGDIFSVNDLQAEHFRATVIESLMTNHPHDCPVCEEGGECHLQDMTEMSGHTSRRYRGTKRTHNNQYLGPLINHEMNRCISCYRCLRFYNDYAGGKDLAAFASHNHVYFGREKEGVLENEFAGNLVEVCPTGVFTDKTFSAHYARKWDLQTAPGICSHCAVGCNTTPGARYERVRRISNRYHSEINGYFLCDRGRFGYGYNHHPERLLAVTCPANSQPASHQSTTRRPAISDLTDESLGLSRLTAAACDVVSNKALMVGIGSPRASLENNYTLQQFVGADNYYLGVSAAEHRIHTRLAQIISSHALNICSVKQAEKADLIVVLGEDIAETAPRMSLALRQAIRNKGKTIAAKSGIVDWQDAAVRRYCPDEKTPLFIASLSSTRLDAMAEKTIHLDPREIGQLGFYIAGKITGQATEKRLNETQQQWAQQVIDALEGALRPLIVTGLGYQQPALLEASISLFNAVKINRPLASYYCVLPEVNSLGAALLDGESLPRKNQSNNNKGGERKADGSTDRHYLNVLEPLRTARKHGQRTVMVILENDLYRSIDSKSVDELLTEVDELIVLDHSQHTTTARADWCLPVTTAFESQGTWVSAEARAQCSYSVIQPADTVKHSWRWLVNAAIKAQQLNNNCGFDNIIKWQCCRDITLAIANEVAGFSAIRALIADTQPKLARQSHRYSGRTAMHAMQNVAEPPPAYDKDSPFTYSMEGVQAHGPLENSAWSPGWNSNQAIHKFQQEVAGALLGGESGVKLFPYNSDVSLPSFNPAQPSDSVSLENVSSGNVSLENTSSGNVSSESWLLFPVQHVFGSEPLSARADAIAELSPEPYLLLNSSDAEILQVKEWDTLRCGIDDQQQFYVRIDNKIPTGMAAVFQPQTILKSALSNHWPIAADLVKDLTPLPKPALMIATDREASHVR